MKKISIIMAAWNTGKYIQRALDAIEKQDYEAIQLIIVNDGSTDNTKSIIERYIPKFTTKNRELLLINQSNQGAAKAFNVALKHCKGDYLYWQDSDDWLEPNVLSKMIGILENEPKYQIIRGGCNIRNEEDVEKNVKTKYSGHISDEDIFDSYIFENDSYCFNGVFMARMEIVRSRIIEKGIFVSEAGQNWQLILPLSYSTNCKNIELPIINYLVRKNSHSHKKKTLGEQIKRCSQHQKIIIETIKRIDEMPRRKKNEYSIRVHKKYAIKKFKLVIKAIMKGAI